MIGGGILMVAGAGLVIAEHILGVVGLRLLTGIGEALLLVGGISVVNDLAPEHRRGEAVSLYTIASYSGLAIGPVLGELTLGDDRWDAVWLLAALSGATAGVLGFRSPDAAPDPPLGGGGAGFRTARGLPGVVPPGLDSLAGRHRLTLTRSDVGLEGAGRFRLFVVFVVTTSLGARPRPRGPARTARIALIALAAGLAMIGTGRSPSASTSARSSSRSARRSPSRGLTLAILRAFVRDARRLQARSPRSSTSRSPSVILLGGAADLGGYSTVFLVSAAAAPRPSSYRACNTSRMTDLAVVATTLAPLAGMGFRTRSTGPSSIVRISPRAPPTPRRVRPEPVDRARSAEDLYGGRLPAIRRQSASAR